MRNQYRGVHHIVSSSRSTSRHSLSLLDFTSLQMEFSHDDFFVLACDRNWTAGSGMCLSAVEPKPRRWTIRRRNLSPERRRCSAWRRQRSAEWRRLSAQCQSWRNESSVVIDPTTDAKPTSNSPLDTRQPRGKSPFESDFVGEAGHFATNVPRTSHNTFDTPRRRHCPS